MDTLKTMLAAYHAGDRNFPTYKELEAVAADIARLEQALAGRQEAIGGLNTELAKCGVQSSRLRAAILALPCTPPKGYGDFFAGVATEIYGQILRDVADLVGQSGGVVQQAGDERSVALSKRLREYAANSGYSHGDYADAMRQAADDIGRRIAHSAIDAVDLDAYESLCQSKDAQLAALAAQPAQQPLAVPHLSDDQIVKVLASLGIDADKSKYGFPELQVGTTVPNIRKIVAAYLAAAPAQAAAVPAIASWSTGEPLPGVECEICDDTGRTFGKVCACGGGK